MMISHARIRQFLTFAVIGVVGTAAHYTTLITLVELFGHSPVLGTVVGFLVGAVVNYFLNHRLTFHSTKRHREAMGKFLTVAGSGFALNGLLMAFLVNQIGIPYLWAQIPVTGFLLIWHYVLNAIWTFREH